jgi:hypothetical protein
MQSSLVLEQVPDLQLPSTAPVTAGHQTPPQLAQVLEDAWAPAPLRSPRAHVSASVDFTPPTQYAVQHLALVGVGPQPTFPAGNGSFAENVTHPDESVTFLWSAGHPLKGRMSCIPGVSPALRP